MGMRAGMYYLLLYYLKTAQSKIIRGNDSSFEIRLFTPLGVSCLNPKLELCICPINFRLSLKNSNRYHRGSITVLTEGGILGTTLLEVQAKFLKNSIAKHTFALAMNEDDACATVTKV